MQTRGRNERLAESGEKMVLHGLRVAGESGRARASLGNSRLSIEFKNGNCIDIRYDRIVRMQHHNTTLIPGWIAFVGFCILYASWRVITPPNLRLIGLGIGLTMISGWVLTKRPTLTLDTELGDCHVLHAIDSRLLKLSTMIQRMNDGLSLEEARVGVDLLNEDTEFPRQTAAIAALSLPAPMEDLEPARSLSSFLGRANTEQEEFEIDEVLPRWAKDTMNQRGEVGFESEQRAHGILKRGIENAGTRRGHVSPLDMNATPGPGQLPETQFVGDAPLPIPMHQKPMSSSKMIHEAMEKSRDVHGASLSDNLIRPSENHAFAREEHMPSTADVFVSPDLPLMNAELIDNEPELSLVEQGMIRSGHQRPTQMNTSARVRRNSKGQPKRIQPRTTSRKRIASTRSNAEQEQPRRFSSLINRVRSGISGLREQGIDEEMIDIMTEHIQQEDENPVPSSFSALTESQETAPAQMSEHGLRRLD